MAYRVYAKMVGEKRYSINTHTIHTDRFDAQRELEHSRHLDNTKYKKFGKGTQYKIVNVKPKHNGIFHVGNQPNFSKLFRMR